MGSPAGPSPLLSMYTFCANSRNFPMYTTSWSPYLSLLTNPNMSSNVLTPSCIWGSDSVSSFYLLSVLGIAIFSLVLFFPTDGIVISIWFSSSLSYSDLVFVFCWFIISSTYTCSSDCCTCFAARCYTSFVCFLDSSDYVCSSSSSFICSFGCSSPNSVCCAGFFSVLGFSYSLCGSMSIPSFVEFCCSFSYTTFRLTSYIIGDGMASTYTTPSI
jgi:hypothetical protein